MRARRMQGPVNGCPEADTDGDGIVDSQDACPNDANHDGVGDPCNHDEDADGVDDFNDACPTEVGPVNGCPEADTDGDGIVDSQDACPNDANHDGVGDPCNHDEDADGVDDFNDACPDGCRTCERLPGSRYGW